MERTPYDGGATARASGLPLRKVAVVGLGNALEFYDFLTFSYFSLQISRTFFPVADGLLLTLATFGAGFMTRPLGGFIIGRYGDRAGRKPAMLWSFGLMGVASIGLAATPSYAEIGAAAPLLLVVFRLLQGFAVGGEVGPSAAFLLESAPAHRRGLYVGLLCATVYVAVVVAGVVGFVLAATLSAEALDAWGWRIAFALGAAIVPVGLMVRRRLPEPGSASTSDRGLVTAERVPVHLVVAGVCIIAATTVTSYAMGYMTTYLQDTLRFSPRVAFGETVVEGLTVVSVALLAGRLSDRIGRKTVMFTGLGLLLVAVLPGYALLVRIPSVPLVYALSILFNGLYAAFWAAATVAILESLPRASRSGSYGLLYSATVACFGALTQFAMKWLIVATGSPLAPAVYLSAALLLGGVGMALLPESLPGRVKAPHPHRT